MAKKSKSVNEFIDKLVDDGWWYNVQVVQLQTCFKDDGTSDKHYTLMVLYNERTASFLFCKLYGPRGKWTGWETWIYFDQTSVDSAFDDELAKRRQRGYTDTPIYNLEHATTCLNGILKLKVKRREAGNTSSDPEYSIIRDFVTYGNLSQSSMILLNDIYKSITIS